MHRNRFLAQGRPWKTVGNRQMRLRRQSSGSSRSRYLGRIILGYPAWSKWCCYRIRSLFAHQQRFISRPEDRLSNEQDRAVPLELVALSSDLTQCRIQAHELECHIAHGSKAWLTPLEGSIRRARLQAREARQETQEQEQKLKAVRERWSDTVPMVASGFIR